jgi:hypothetical protein
LKSLNSTAPEVWALPSALTAKAQDSREALKAQDIGNALFGSRE